MLLLRQSTASQEALIGPFLDDTDGKTAETGLTIANTDILIWKAGATAEVAKNSGGATHVAAGRYYIVLDATDTGTLGSGEINVHVSGALPVRREFLVLTALVYDSLVVGSDNLQVDAIQLAGQTITAASGVTFPTSVASPTNITAGTITTVTTVTNQLTAAAIATAVLDAFATASDAVEASPSPTTTAFEGSNSLSSTDDFYNGSVLVFTSGTLDGIARKIADYTGSTRLITVSPALPVAPTAADTFRILGRID